MLKSLSFEGVLERGFVVVQDEKGRALTAAEQTAPGQAVDLRFKGGRRVGAVIKGGDK
jgi:exodeoxyribonuclease VII large subunit